jgi:uncharacterized protein YcnI
MNIRTLLASLLIVAAPMASAHIVFEQKQAPAAATTRARCWSAMAATAARRAVTVTIPDGVQGVHPQPKPGWQLEIKRAKLAKPYLARQDHRRGRARSGGLATRSPTNTSTNSAC